MQCKQCGNILPDGAQFCNHCGVKFMPPPPPAQPYPIHPPYPAQPPYPQQPYTGQNLSAPMSTWDFIKMYLLLLIPIANIVLVFVWAFGDNVNINKRNLMRANLIVTGIGLGLYFVILLCIALVVLIVS